MVRGWFEKTVDEISPLQRGFDLPTSKIINGEYPVVYSNGIGATHNVAMVKAPGVVTGRSGTIGSLTFVDKDYFPHNTTLWVTDFKENDALFIYFLLHQIDWQRFATGSGVPTLNRNDVHELRLSIPEDITEQRRIAEALSDTDALITALEKLIAKKRAVKQGAMQELLTGKRRLLGFSGEWVETTLGESCEIKDGTHQTPKYVDYGIPFYSVENVTSGDFRNTKFISPNEHRFLTANYKIKCGDILMTRIGSIGVCKYVDWNVGASFYVSLALLKCRNKIDARFLSLYSQSEQFQKEIELHSLQHAIPKKINIGNLALVRLTMPTLTEQTAIAEILSDMNAEIDAMTAKLDKLRNIKQGMMSELLTGRIRLEEDTDNGKD